METREEIQSMRVVDLRDFLRRYGRSTTTHRTDGTPAQLRKSELLDVALDVRNDYETGHPSPIPPAMSSNVSPPNPFQSGLPSPSRSRKPVITPDTTPDKTPTSTAAKTPSKPVTWNPNISEQHPQPQRPATTQSSQKPRRRSSAWVNPALLAQMRATTPTKPSQNDQSLPMRPVASRSSAVTPQRMPSRVLPEPSPIKPPQRVHRPPPETTAAHAQRLPSRVLAAVTETLRPPTRDKPNRAPVDNLRPPLRAEPRRVHDAPPPVVAVHPAARTTHSPSSAKSKLLLDVGDQYHSEEDPDYDEQGEDADDEDFDDDDFDEDAAETAIDNIAWPVPKHDPLKHNAMPVYEQHLHPIDADIQEDIPVLSDHYHSDSAGDSDRGSTFESEDESRVNNFEDWSTSSIRSWLRDHGVRYRSDASRDELVSIARAHVLHIEATESLSRLNQARQKQQMDDDQILPASSASKPRRRRFISAPLADEDSDTVEPAPAREDGARSSKRKSAIRMKLPGNKKADIERRGRRRPFFALIPLVVLSVFLCSSGLVAFSVLHKHLNMSYCDTDAPAGNVAPSTTFASLTLRLPASVPPGPSVPGARNSTAYVYTSFSKRLLTVFNFLFDCFSFTLDPLVNQSDCKPCPVNGQCKAGMLYCDPGYVEMRSRCFEDRGFNLLSEKIAYSGFELLSELAGRAECGEEISRAISSADLSKAMTDLYSRRYKRRHQQFDANKLEDAMLRAIHILQSDDAFDVSITDGGYIMSNVPAFSIECRVRRKLWEYIQPILATGAILLLVVYIKFKRYLRQLHEARLDEAHAAALEYLRGQVNGFRNNEEDVAFVADAMLREEVVGRPTGDNIKFWKEVEERLNRDARVIRKHQVVKGMPSYTFEYVGSRRTSGGRSSGTFFDTLSRRSSFGSRTSMDSLDLRHDRDTLDQKQRNGVIGFIWGLFSQDAE